MRRRGTKNLRTFIAHPPAFILTSCGVAKLVRRRIVNAATRRFESFRHSQYIAVSGRFQFPISFHVRVLHLLRIDNSQLRNSKLNLIDPELE